MPSFNMLREYKKGGSIGQHSTRQQLTIIIQVRNRVSILQLHDTLVLRLSNNINNVSLHIIITATWYNSFTALRLSGSPSRFTSIDATRVLAAHVGRTHGHGCHQLGDQLSDAFNIVTSQGILSIRCAGAS